MMSSNGNKVSPLEMETLNGDDKSSSSSSPQIPMMRPIGGFLENAWALLCAYLDYYRAIVIPVVAVLIIFLVIFSLEAIAYYSTTRHVASITNDFTGIHSQYELKMQEISHWCLSGGDDECRCDDPTMSTSREEFRGWSRAHKANKKLLRDIDYPGEVDVVLLGDETTEEWNGRWYGTPNEDTANIKKFFEKNFNRTSGGDVDGVALGIAGDSIANLLWRLEHGEMPEDLNPKVWWISIGGNDLYLGQCSEETVLLGMLNLAEYIATKKPGSIVVINSILPRIKKIKPRQHNTFKPFDLYPSIQVVNEQLEVFCSKHSEFRFFDANNIFFTSPPPKSLSGGDKKNKHKANIPTKLPPLKESMMSEDGRVTSAGHKEWGNQIIEKVKFIMYDGIYHDQGLFDDEFTDDYDFRP